MGKIIVRGTLDKFKAMQPFLNKGGADYDLRSCGGSAKLDYVGSDLGMRFTAGLVKGGFMCAMIKKDVDSYIEKNGIVKNYNKGFSLVKFRPDLIEKIINKDLLSIDLNRCHLQTAYNLGYVSKDTYDRGFNDPEIKKGVNVAIGSLNKLEKIDKYRAGKLIETVRDYATYNRYSPFYWNIIYEVWKMMEDFFIEFPSNTFMWLTDCAYISPEIKEKAFAFFAQRGYSAKTADVKFVKMDQESNYITWHDYKDNINKRIRYCDYLCN